jgi:hypothetical protein
VFLIISTLAFSCKENKKTTRKIIHYYHIETFEDTPAWELVNAIYDEDTDSLKLIDSSNSIIRYPFQNRIPEKFNDNELIIDLNINLMFDDSFQFTKVKREREFLNGLKMDLVGCYLTFCDTCSNISYIKIDGHEYILNCNSPFSFWDFKNKIDTIKFFDELLSYQNDLRLNTKGMNYKMHRFARTYSGKPNYFSIQVEALFIIEYFYDIRRDGAFCPCLVNKKTGEEEAIQGPIVDEAYRAFKKWFEKVKVIGLDSVRNLNMNPLDSSFVRWY